MTEASADRGPHRVAASERWFSLLSLGLFSALVLGYLWWGKFDYHHALWSWITYGGAGLLVVANHLGHRDDRKRLGWRVDNFGAAAALFGGFTVMVGGGIAAAGLIWGEAVWIGPEAAFTYALWALLQQHLMQNFLRLRSEEAFSAFRSPVWPAIATAAGLFAVYHLPNPTLTLLTFVAAACWCFLFSRTPSLPWAAISQTALTLLLAVFFKFTLLDQFAVGRAGYRFDFYGGGVKVAGGIDAEGNPVVATLPGPDRGVPAVVQIFDPEGNRKRIWTAFEDLGFSGELAVGDLGFGPGDEIAVSPGPGAGNPARVKIFSLAGELLEQFEVPQLTQGYGLWISIGCGRLYVCPGPAPGAEASVLEMSPEGRVLQSWDFESLDLVNGVRATPVCPDSPQSGDGLLLVWGTDVSVNPSTVFVFDRARRRFLEPLETLKTTFGVQIAVAGRGRTTAIAAAPGPLRGYPPLVRVIDLSGRPLHQFAGEIPGDLGCGATLGSLDSDRDGVPEWLVGDGACPGQPGLVRLHAFDGRPIRSWNAAVPSPIPD